MTHLLVNISQLVCVASSPLSFSRGRDMQNLHCINNASMLFDERILWVGSHDEGLERFAHSATVIDAGARVVMPGFVDSHSHVVFAGNRADEYARRLQGVSYQQIAAEGGGILSTVRAVRAASEDELYEQGRKLALSATRHGTTTLEIKSGYALSLDDELKMLRAIRRLQQSLPVRIVATFLGAHDLPPEWSQNRSGYVREICENMLPAVAKQSLATVCDVFCDTGYFTVDESRMILQSARELGLATKVHADELSCVHAAELAVELQSWSADHLLFVGDMGITALASSDTVATLLPGTAYTLRLPYAPARSLIEAGAVVAVASDCNPGSCFSENMQGVISLACTNMHMSIEESIHAATLNGAWALRCSDSRGSLQPGMLADFLLLDCSHYAELSYHFGVNHVKQTWIGGECVSDNG